ncbi:cation/H(+) antiporter 10 [Capsella rubella]|uniref:cation/H(+) antiporter 10 n=1 Tax=Capsella rubella TaxID=81985 RepID=UPI000CD51541|nr:cation/H(+) antiporter 10 [Capsella rubella]
MDDTTIYLSGDCRVSFFNISSQGLFENLNSPDVIFEYSLPLLEMQILVIFFAIVMSHMFLRRLGISPIASYMMAGIVLGPQLFNVLERSSRKLSVDPALDGSAMLRSISVFGTIMFTFLMTVRTSRRVAFHSGKLPVVIGIVSFFVPLFGLGLQNLFSDSIDPHYMPLDKALGERTAIIITQSAILLPSTTYILLELKILNSELGRLALSASIINDILGIFSMVLASLQATYTHVSHLTAYRDFIAVIIFLLIVFLVFKPAVQWIIDRTPEDKPVENMYVDVVIITALASAAYFVFFNMKYILGPLMIGLIIPEGPPLGSALEAKYEKLTMNVFLPISITVSAMRCDGISIYNQFNDIFFNIFLTFLTLFLKLVSCFGPSLYYKLPLNESMAVSLILSYKSFHDFVLYEAVLDDKYISQATYAFLIIFSLLNAGIVPMVLRSMYDPKRKYVNYQKRDILHLEPNSDLRILTCLHKPENVSETIAFLQLLSSPNLDFPMAVTVLHLVKLAGQINPIMVPHNKNLKRLNHNSYIHTANLAFRQFMLESLESVTVTTFTAFSHENLMHEDICTLALDQSTSMIVLPSGRKWTMDGMFEFDDNAIRNLNQSLLDRAPCSIGILVDRGQFSRKSIVSSKKKYNIDVGVIFIGGKDDREALALVKKMKHNTRVSVTVTRLVFKQEAKPDWDYILDNEGLKDIKVPEENNDIVYTERIVTSGAEVVTVVRSLAEVYDLMVVGRDHDMTSKELLGLMEWVELPELGVIGDLLAAKDLNSNVSVLVVQQQQQQV